MDVRVSTRSGAEGVVGHVLEPVGHHRERGGNIARAHGGDELPHVDGMIVELGGQPAVAVVVPDHITPAVGQRTAEVLVPGEHLGTEAHDEQNGAVTGVAKGLVGEGHPGRHVSDRHSGSMP